MSDSSIEFDEIEIECDYPYHECKWHICQELMDD